MLGEKWCLCTVRARVEVITVQEFFTTFKLFISEWKFSLSKYVWLSLTEGLLMKRAKKYHLSTEGMYFNSAALLGVE